MKKASSFTRVFLVISVCLLTAASAIAQTPTPTPLPEEEGIVKVNSRLIVIPVSVTDSAGNPVIGLKADDFTVIEEGRRQTIDSIGDADKVPLDIALLFDVSASTDAMFKFEQETAAKFLREVMRPIDTATIYTVGMTPVQIQPRDTAEKSIASLMAIPPTKGATAFFDTVKQAANYLRTSSPEGRRRVILVISDGDDNYSEGVQKAGRLAERGVVDSKPDPEFKGLAGRIAFAQQSAKISERANVVKSLQDADSVFFSINPGGSSYLLNTMSVFGQENMQKFAVETGGTAYLPKFQPIDTKDALQNASNLRKNTATLDGIFKQLMNELQAQYLVQYYSDSEYPTGRYVKLKVGLQNTANRKLRAREGYFVKN
jgi:Ca-activated chloride channel family protein